MFAHAGTHVDAKTCQKCFGCIQDVRCAAALSCMFRAVNEHLCRRCLLMLCYKKIMEHTSQSESRIISVFMEHLSCFLPYSTFTGMECNLETNKMMEQLCSDTAVAAP